MSIVSTAKMTARQFLELGEDPAGIRLELVNGEVAVSPSPIPDHSHVVVQLTVLLGQHIQKRKLGRLYADVDTIFSTYDVRRPDLLYFSKGRTHLVGKKAMKGSPDLCIEVISPSSSVIDRKDKFAQYAKGGVRFYWIVDPQDQSIEGYTLNRGKYVLSGKGVSKETITLPPFKDIKIRLSDLWHPND
jgi:Uma2 family endonuclease